MNDQSVLLTREDPERVFKGGRDYLLIKAVAANTETDFRKYPSLTLVIADRQQGTVQHKQSFVSILGDQPNQSVAVINETISPAKDIVIRAECSDEDLDFHVLLVYE